MTRPHARRIVRLRQHAFVAALALAGPLHAAAPADALSILGTGLQPLTLSLADLAAMPRTTVKWSVHDKTLTCEGPWLTDVLAKAGTESGEALRGKALGRVVVATGADGYRVAFTLGELDHALGNAPVLVADRCDGAALPASDGPVRLVAAKDTRGARSVRQLTRLEVLP